MVVVSHVHWLCCCVTMETTFRRMLTSKFYKISQQGWRGAQNISGDFGNVHTIFKDNLFLIYVHWLFDLHLYLCEGVRSLELEL